MTSNWAAKLAAKGLKTGTAAASSPQKGAARGNSSPNGLQNGQNGTASQTSHHNNQNGPSAQNSQNLGQNGKLNYTELLAHFHSQHTHFRKQACEGLDVSLYVPGPFQTQWKTKPSKKQDPTKYVPKEVVRTHADLSGSSTGSIDLLFELNRSIYQQQTAARKEK